MNRERIQKIIDHMRSNQVGHTTFDFSVINQTVRGTFGDYYHPSEGQCGTHGCILGEFPFIFPGDWVFGSKGGIRMVGSHPLPQEPPVRTDDVAGWLDIEETWVMVLFFPGHVTECLDDLGFKYLAGDASLDDVLHNLEELVIISP